jgi:hypothetical protein
LNESRLTAWLRRIPVGAHRLEIRRDGVGGRTVVASYERAELEQLGGVAELLVAIQEDCDDLGSGRARYEVVWLSEAGRELACKPCLCQLSAGAQREQGIDAEDVYDRVAGRQDPSAHGITIALMRSMEVRERMWASSNATVIKTALDMLRDQRAENSDLRAENKSLRQVLRKTEDGSTLTAEAAAAEHVAKAETWNKLGELIQQHLPTLLERLHH